MEKRDKTIYLKYIYDKDANIENISKDMAMEYYSKSEDLIIKREENGKPYFCGEENIFFNGSHSKDLIAVAISDKFIGIDAEFIKKRNFLEVAEEYFSFNEYKYLKSSHKLEIDFFTLWTLKEAYIKTFGKKIFDIKDSIEIDLDEKVIYNSDDLFFATFILDNCYIISVCCDIKSEEAYKDIIIKMNGFNSNLIFAYPEFPQIEII